VSDTPLLRVALTFDAEHPDRPWCPPGNAEHILDVLDEEATQASFFIQGRWAESQPVTARRIATDGHVIGHHSHYHARMPLLDDDGLRSDILDAQAVIERTTGVDPRPWFRCPFGAGSDDARVLAVLADLGYRNVHWDVELADWESTRTGTAITQDALRAVEAHGDGAIVLLHTWPGGTGEAISPMIHGLRALGTTFVPIDELEVAP
jgi:peptidoglycan-N-acetylglucosamine deacetylase